QPSRIRVPTRLTANEHRVTVAGVETTALVYEQKPPVFRRPTGTEPEFVGVMQAEALYWRHVDTRDVSRRHEPTVPRFALSENGESPSFRRLSLYGLSVASLSRRAFIDHCRRLSARVLSPPGAARTERHEASHPIGLPVPKLREGRRAGDLRTAAVASHHPATSTLRAAKSHVRLIPAELHGKPAVE